MPFVPQALGQAQRVRDSVFVDFTKRSVPRALDVKRRPFRLKRYRHPPGMPHQFCGGWVIVDANQDLFAGRPRTANGVCLHVIDHVAIDVLSDLAQGEFTQGR